MTAQPPRRVASAAALVAVVALCARVGWVLREGPPAPLAGDAVQYQTYADSVVATGRYAGPQGDRASRMPGYPLFLAGIETLCGPSTRAVQWAQCLLGSLACVFILLWTRTFLDPSWALACGLAAACYSDLIVPASWTLTECLYSFLIAASFGALYADGWSADRRALVGGGVMGLTAMVRPEVLPFSGMILAGSPWLLKKFTPRAAALALAAFLVFPLAWAGRNALVLHRFVPVSTIGTYSRYLGLRLALDKQSLDIGPYYVAPEGLDELARDAAYGPAFEEVRAKAPLEKRLKAYVYNLITVYYPFLPQYDWTYGLLVPFWLFGLWLAATRRELMPAAVLVVGLSAVFAVLAGPVSRYRFGFSPCLIALAGAGAQELYGRVGKKAFARGAAGWTLLNLALWLGAAPARQAVLALKAALVK
jgi:hypothetical protein